MNVYLTHQIWSYHDSENEEDWRKWEKKQREGETKKGRGRKHLKINKIEKEKKAEKSIDLFSGLATTCPTLVPLPGI